jgi:hypothetical protein
LTSKIRLPFANPFQAELIGLLVALSAGRPNGRTFLGVEHPELQPVMSVALPISPPKRVNLARQMTFGQTADGRVAGHLADGVGIDGQQQSFAPMRAAAKRSLDAGMTRADHDHIILFG